MKNDHFKRKVCVAAIGSLIASHAYGVVVNDTLTGASSSYGWQTRGGACLTAGDGTGSIPACVGLPYYSGKIHVGGVTGRLPDIAGFGALRLTNGDVGAGSNGNNNTGSVVSTDPFPTNQGVQVTFTTATYGGNGFRNSANVASGADGIAFFLMDGTKPPSVGAFGGSLGYSCSQTKNPADGVDGGYLAVAIDEFGNFSNPGDATSDGPGSRPGHIVVRGAGSITFAALNQLNALNYPLTLTPTQKLNAVRNTCRTGFLQDWSNLANIRSTTTRVDNYRLLTAPQPLPVPIFNQQAMNMPLRANANLLTYSLSITQDGLLSLSYSANGGANTQMINKQSILANNGPLPPSFRFGFTSGTGGGSNVHEILCFKAAQINVANNSAGGNVQQTARVQTGSQVYLAFYHPLNSWGELTASDLATDPTGNLIINPTPNWNAHCVLTGACTAGAGAQSSSNRKILSWSGSSGIPFKYSNLSSTQKAAIGGSTDGSDRVEFLRGDRSKELTQLNVGQFRKRDGVLGDIINGSPVWVGGPSLSYDDNNKDLLTGRTIAEFGTSYKNFKTANAARTNVVYVGANDGMLHGFRASGPNDGAEVIAYVPDAVVTSIHTATNTSLDFSSPQYAHNYFVDASPGTGDLFYQNAWRTWLVGGTGSGGNATGTVNDATSTANGVLYALDITDPSTFSESAAGTIVKGEWNSSNITCVNDSTCGTKFGSTYGTPIIRLLHDGNWAAIFGNGRNSATGAAGIFIMKIDKMTGERTFRYIDTGTSSTTTKNGIDYVTSADLDSDRVTDYVYAGDAKGNVWRFDLTNANPANWAVSSTPLFSTPSGQPISTRIAITATLQKVGSARVILNFGTGKQTPMTLTNGTAYAIGTQSYYGIWDWNMSAWNAQSGDQYGSLTAPQTILSANLQTQTITTTAGGYGTISGYRTSSQNAVCWKGSTFCAANNNKLGWKFDLPIAGEQIIYNPIVAFGTLFFNTTIPAVNQTLSCASQPASGYTMAINVETGGAPNSSAFTSTATSAGIPTTALTGIGLSGTGTPSIVTSGNKRYMVQQTSSGMGAVTEINPVSTGKGKRVTWVKLR